MRYKSQFWHHFLALLLFYVALKTKKSIMLYPQILLVELSSIFLNIMWFAKELRASGTKDSKLYTVSSICFITSFFLFRVIYFPHMVKRILTEPEFETGMCSDHKSMVGGQVVVVVSIVDMLSSSFASSSLKRGNLWAS